MIEALAAILIPDTYTALAVAGMVDDDQMSALVKRPATPDDLRAAGYVPAVLLTQERETSRRLQAALNRIVGFVSAEQAGWAIYDAEVNQ